TLTKRPPGATKPSTKRPTTASPATPCVTSVMRNSLVESSDSCQPCVTVTVPAVAVSISRFCPAPLPLTMAIVFPDTPPPRTPPRRAPAPPASRLAPGGPRPAPPARRDQRVFHEDLVRDEPGADAGDRHAGVGHELHLLRHVPVAGVERQGDDRRVGRVD